MERPLTIAGSSLLTAWAVQLVRLAAITVALGFIASHFGALALLASAPESRPRGYRRSTWSRIVIESPLVTKTLFTVGPVPITKPVIVTWSLMAALALASVLLTRSLGLMQGGLLDRLPTEAIARLRASCPPGLIVVRCRPST